MTATRTPSTSRRKKVTALLVAGLVAGVGVTSTLAVWNDTEWITGGVDTDGDGIADAPGVGTSTFEVQQNVSAPFDDAAWADREVAPGGALEFTPGALALAPGDATYAPVSLRTTAESIAAETITLAAGNPAPGILVDDPDGLLFATLGLRVIVNETATGTGPAECSADLFTADATYVVGSDAGPVASLFDGGVVASDLGADAADRLDYCFEITLPEGAPDELQGRTVAPAWQFLIESL